MEYRRLRHAYKGIQLRQLRGFCETARCGSLSAAAQELGLSQPTVWEQVRSLEREFGTQLIEAHGRGCRLTDDGKLLVQLVAPLVESIHSLKPRFQQARAHHDITLIVATTQRVFVEDLPAPLAVFLKEQPHIHLELLEVTGAQTAQVVEDHQADVGFTTEQAGRAASPWLEFEKVYQLEPILIAPRQHPLAKKKQVQPQDMAKYPLLNAVDGGFADASVAAILEKHGAFQPARQRVRARFTSVIRRYVELGLGVGLVPGLPGRKTAPALHERSMSRYFGHIAINAVWRKGDLHQDAIRLLTETVRGKLG
jgi:molybdate transport repressor ModE-like protein